MSSSQQREAAPLLANALEEGAATPEATPTVTSSAWTARRGIVVIAVTAVLGASAVLASGAARPTGTAALAKKHTLESSSTTFTYGEAQLDLTVQETPNPSKDIGEKSTTVYIDSSGIPEDFLNYANTVVTMITTAHVQSLSITSSTGNYAAATGVPSHRRLARDNDPNGSLATRSSAATSSCTKVSTSDSGKIQHECVLAHAHSDAFAGSVMSVYKGFFQMFKEVFSQMTTPDTVTALMTGQWDMAIDGNTLVFKVHPGDDTTQTSWKLVAQGTDGSTANTVTQEAIQYIAKTLDPAATDACESTAKGQTTVLECTTSMSSTAGLVMGIDMVLQAFPTAI